MTGESNDGDSARAVAAAEPLVIELRPPYGTNRLVIGMSMAEAKLIMADFADVSAAPRDPGLAWLRADGWAVFGYADSQDRLEAIEIAPAGPPGEPIGGSVRFGGLDVFATPASTIIEELTSTTEVLELEDGDSYLAPNLLLSFWRGGDDQGVLDARGRARYFHSVLVAAPGYG